MDPSSINSDPVLTSTVVKENLWGGSDLFLVDVGCSGGLDDFWSVFEPKLFSVGFDGLENEIRRLKQSFPGKKTQWEAALVGCKNFDELIPVEVREDESVGKFIEYKYRTSSIAAEKLLDFDYKKEVFNSGEEYIVSSRLVTLDDYFNKDQYDAIDFLKIDTDGHDIEVLEGASNLLATGGILGVLIESQFHGPQHPYSNTFENIDRKMRSAGYTLFDLSLRKYSRPELPFPFAWDMLAQTVRGQLMWADALYFRDFGYKNYEQVFGISASPEKLLKLCCLYELFNLQDCAAELLLNCRDRFSENIPMEKFLDMLTPSICEEHRTYKEHMDLFRQNPKALFRSVCNPEALAEKRAQEREEQLIEERDRLKKELEVNVASAEKAWAAYHQVESEYKKVTASRGWKLINKVRSMLRR